MLETRRMEDFDDLRINLDDTNPYGMTRRSVVGTSANQSFAINCSSQNGK
jgi:hypothetical protein